MEIIWVSEVQKRERSVKVGKVEVKPEKWPSDATPAAATISSQTATHAGVRR